MSMSKDFKRFLGMDVKFLYNTNGSKVQLSHLVYITSRFSEFVKKRRTPMSATDNLRDARCA